MEDIIMKDLYKYKVKWVHFKIHMDNINQLMDMINKTIFKTFNLKEIEVHWIIMLDMENMNQNTIVKDWEII
jgi:hypothetical protein